MSYDNNNVRSGRTHRDRRVHPRENKVSLARLCTRSCFSRFIWHPKDLEVFTLLVNHLQKFWCSNPDSANRVVPSSHHGHRPQSIVLVSCPLLRRHNIVVPGDLDPIHYHDNERRDTQNPPHHSGPWNADNREKLEESRHYIQCSRSQS